MSIAPLPIDLIRAPQAGDPTNPATRRSDGNGSYLPDTTNMVERSRGLAGTEWVTLPPPYDDAALQQAVATLNGFSYQTTLTLIDLLANKLEIWSPGPKVINRIYLLQGGIGTGFYRAKNNYANSQSVSLANYERIGFLPTLDVDNLLPLLAPLQSPAFTGTPTAPTAFINTMSNQVATTQYVANAFNTAPMYVAYNSAGVLNNTFTDLRSACQYASSTGGGGRVITNRPGQGSPQSLLLATGTTLDLNNQPLDLAGAMLHLYDGAQVINNRLIYNGTIFIRNGLGAGPPLIQGGIVSTRLTFQAGQVEQVILDGATMANFGQGGNSTTGAFTVTLRNGGRFYNWAPDAATAVVIEPVYPASMFQLTAAFMDSVIGLTYVDCDADPATSPPGSMEGQQFDATDPDDGKKKHYYCSRPNYVQGAPVPAVLPAWHCTLKAFA